MASPAPRPPSDRDRPVILIDATSLRTPSGVRGIGRYIHDLLVGLEALRAEWEPLVDLVALTDLGRTGAALYERDLAQVARQARAGNTPVVTNAQTRWRRRFFLEKAAHNVRATLLHEAEAIGTPVVPSVPRLVTCYDLIQLRYPREYLGTIALYPTRWWIEWRRYSIARRIVCISERTRVDLCGVLRVPPSRVFTVRTGIDLASWMALEDAGDGALGTLGIEPGRPFLVYVGGADYRKNVEGMMAALAEARKQVDVDLVWAGRLPPEEKRRVIALAQKAGVVSHVKLLGYVDDPTLATLYRRAIASLYISRLEGFGLPVLEAMALRCPSITATGSGADEVAGDCGFQVSADDAVACAEVIVKLVRDPELRLRSSQRGQERAAGFTHLDMARGYVEHYLDMVDRRPLASR